MLTFFFTSSLNDGSDAGAEHLDELIEKIAAGNRDALASLYEQTNKSVYGFALSILKDTHDAQDVLQDCYLHIYSAAGSYRSQGKPMAWILTITRNLCLKCRQAHSKCAPMPEEDRSFIPQEDAEFSAEDKMMLSLCMKSLSAIGRQIVVLHAVSGLKHREIAALLKMPLPTVLSNYNRAIKKLQNAWEKGVQ